MGGSCSKQQERRQQREDAKKQDFQSFLGGVKQSIEDEVARKMMLQREIQLSINLAKARDNFMIFGSAWLTLVTGAGVAHVMGRPVPPVVVGAPIVVGGLLLGNLADLAYGNKLNRVVNEAEYILYHERGRLVPPQQAAFFKFYTDAERALYYDTARPVGVLYPNALLFPRKSSGGGSSSDKNNSQ